MVKNAKKVQNNAIAHSPNLHGDAWIVYLCIGKFGTSDYIWYTKIFLGPSGPKEVFQWARVDF